MKFQHTATRRWLRLKKAAGRLDSGFNTQPPEGGWHFAVAQIQQHVRFNTQPPEGGWKVPDDYKGAPWFQHTATRRWLAAGGKTAAAGHGFNTQPPEGGCRVSPKAASHYPVSTHSHPKVAGFRVSTSCLRSSFQHTATRRWLRFMAATALATPLFQHTATRRWLIVSLSSCCCAAVSTHSHPKVAGFRPRRLAGIQPRFNTQPPEGGCRQYRRFARHQMFQHTATRRWLSKRIQVVVSDEVSTHSHPKVADSDFRSYALVGEVSTHSHPKVAAISAAPLTA